LRHQPSRHGVADLVNHGRMNRGQLHVMPMDSPRSDADDDRDAELRHEVRAALMGIEAAACALGRNRDLLSTSQCEELSTGLVAEVRRLRVLLEGHRPPQVCFDLHDAIAPVLACARADGIDIRSSVPRGLVVEGEADSAAQVVRALLTNAKRHAPGSLVEVRASALDDGVALYVEDRGPGVPRPLRERIFERRMHALGSDGTGLGLFIARRLMHEQAGAIAVEPRLGGGSSFVLHFRRHTMRQPVVASDLVCLSAAS
jgi:signal transduction histidine kinase